jgi:hypothetical protein
MRSRNSPLLVAAAFARLLVLRSRIQAGVFAADDLAAAYQ